MTAAATLAQEKFRDPLITADGKPRASISLKSLDTLWINTGTLCNLTCRNCYIESSPKNDSLAYITAEEVAAYLDEIQDNNLGTSEIGFTGGEPFMNPFLPTMLEDALTRGFKVTVLTNAMMPMLKSASTLEEIGSRHGDQLIVRVSLDHYTKDGHEAERGGRSWDPALEGLSWLNEHDIKIHVAGRTFIDEDETNARRGYNALFARLNLSIDAHNPSELVLFPEMDATLDVPEITTECWGILDVDPETVMCSTSRMIVKRKGTHTPAVIACTLLPYDEQFEMGQTLLDAAKSVSLNHPHCARFCVLGGAACS
ncbi:MAG: radical SAM protein [Alphaproteobacteria bacterium]|nr:radical SAM protein [Alphaproteobacteria bacterium]